MKIAFVLTRFYPAMGGIINQVLYLAYALYRRGLEVEIHADNIVFIGNRRIALPLSNLKLKSLNVDVLFERTLTPFAPLHMRLLNIQNDVRKIYNIHGHAELFTPTILAQLAKTKNPIVLTTHGTLFSSYYATTLLKHGLKAVLKRILFSNLSIKLIKRYVNIVITLSELERKALITIGIAPHKVIIIENFIPGSYFEFKPQESETILGQLGLVPFKYIITVARIHHSKGIHQAIKAIADLHNQGINIKYVIIGPDEGYLDQCLALARKYNIERSIMYLGFVDKRLILTLERYALAFVLPSYHIEGQPISILEAMSQSTPVIISDTANFIGRTVQHMFNGLVFRYGDVRSLAQTIRMLFEDENLRKKLGVNAFNYAYEHHRLSKAVEKYVRIYRTLYELYH
ncbi:MAG: glycosyltransferase family 4 protein [Thermoprotei archaeon]